MKKGIMGAAVLGTAAAGLGAASMIGAKTLFDRVIPRQDTLKVDLSEFADMEKWEEYKKFMVPNREWLEKQPLEDVEIKAHDGITLRAKFFAADRPTDTLVICNHGYTGRGMRDCASISVFFHQQGYDCLIVDHRAHGDSDGDYIGFGILDRFDCREWIRYVDKRFEGKKKIILYGVSMGATTVLMTCGFTDLSSSVKAVVSDCAFTSPYAVFSHILKRDYHLPSFPIMDITDQMCRKKAGYGFRDYSTLDAVSATTIPILFIHGREDNFVPFFMLDENYNACRSDKERYVVEKAAHGASYYEATEEYQKVMMDFLAKHVK